MLIRESGVAVTLLGTEILGIEGVELRSSKMNRFALWHCRNEQCKVEAFQASISKRTQGKSGCPICTGPGGKAKLDDEVQKTATLQERVRAGTMATTSPWYTKIPSY